jgi:uncharacterized protein
MTKKLIKKTKHKLIIKIFLLVVLFFIVAYFGTSFYIADVLTKSSPNPTIDSSTFVASNVTYATFLAADGVILHGWLFKNTQPNNNNKIIIHVAGFNQNRADDDYYMLFIAHNLYKHGYSILLFDPRESGTSATREDFGQSSGNDVLGAVKFAEQDGFIPQHIGIIADSLGTVATLMVIEKLEDIGPIVIDSGIARMQPLLELRMNKDDNIPPFLFPGIFLFANIVYHIDIKNINPVDHLAKVPNRTFLFIVGAKDTYVPPYNSEELFNASNPASKLIIFPSATHAHAYRSDPNLYLKQIYTFFNQQFSH